MKTGKVGLVLRQGPAGSYFQVIVGDEAGILSLSPEQCVQLGYTLMIQAAEDRKRQILAAQEQAAGETGEGLAAQGPELHSAVWQSLIGRRN